MNAIRATSHRPGYASCCPFIDHQHRARFDWPLYLPNGLRAGRRDQRKWVGPIDSMDGWALHLNHYQDRSCEFFIRVKMVRGSVINAESDKMHNLAYYSKMEHRTNRFADDELARKRGDEWQSRLPRPIEKPWPTEAHAARYFAAYAHLSGDALEAVCHKHMWNASRTRVHPH